ncbi:MAG: hypothetical protein U9R40_06195 [Synergistota bacterium]|nr:hypothetical protein [Synergistota bacterium]
MKEIIFLVEESPEGGFQARALEHSVFTEAETLSDLKEMIKDAVKCHFDEDQGPSGAKRSFSVSFQACIKWPTEALSFPAAEVGSVGSFG